MKSVIARWVSRRPHDLEAGDIEAVAWTAYENFMAFGIAECPDDESARAMLYNLVRREISDEVRRFHPLSRHTSTLARRLREAAESIESIEHRVPDIDELARIVGVSSDVATKAVAAAKAYRSSIFCTLSTGDDEYDLPAGDSGQEIEAQDTEGVCANELAQLSDRERKILTRYYYEGHTMRNIAVELGCTAARAGQIRDGALTKLRGSAALAELAN